MIKEMVVCSVSNDNCSAPASYRVGGLGGGYAENDDRRKQARYECFVCGLPVCGRCSKLIDYLNYGKQRICDNCREEVEK